MSQFANRQLPSHSASVGIARAQTARFVRGALSVEGRDVAELLVSELVTNAVIHGRPPIGLDLTLDAATLRIEVSDAQTELAAVSTRVHAERSIGGRGLRIVDALADQWGVTAHKDRKTVWALLSITKDSVAGGRNSVAPASRHHGPPATGP